MDYCTYCKCCMHLCTSLYEMSMHSFIYFPFFKYKNVKYQMGKVEFISNWTLNCCCSHKKPFQWILPNQKTKQKKKQEIGIFSYLILKGKLHRPTNDDKLTGRISIWSLHMQEYWVWFVHYFRHGSHHAPPQFHWLGVCSVYPKLYWQAIETTLLDDAAHLKSN